VIFAILFTTEIKIFIKLYVHFITYLLNYFHFRNGCKFVRVKTTKVLVAVRL
jgi:hypothetical protein